MVINAEKCIFGVHRLPWAQGRRRRRYFAAAVHFCCCGLSPAINGEGAPGILGYAKLLQEVLPAIADILRPLTDSLRGKKGNDRLEWSTAMLQAFQASKRALTDTTYLAHPMPGAALSLAVVALATHVGAGLHQRRQGSTVWEPLGFFSKKLEPAQTRYSAFDRELLACVTSIRHFCYMLEGRRFVLLTDHKPLTFALGRISKPWTARQTRHLSYIGEYTSDIKHISGVSNVVADMMSRPPPGRSGQFLLHPLLQGQPRRRLT